MRSKNEGKVVDAAVKLLEALHGGKPTPTGRTPDRGGNRAGVDWHMRIGTTMHWMEHTLVQPFPLERQAGETVDKIAHHLEMHRTNLGGPGCYEIILAPDAQIANGPTGDRQLETLDRWVKETAAGWPTLWGGSRSENRKAIDRYKTGRPEGWHKTVTLQRCHAWYAIAMKRTPGSVKLGGRETPDDPETAQKRTVEQAFKKTEKLEKAAKLGDRTVLVFEADQLAFDNLKNIGTAVRGLPRRTTESVNDIILVETAIDPWHAALLKHGDWIRPAGAPPNGLTLVPHDAWRSGGRNAPTNMKNLIMKNLVKVQSDELTDLTASGDAGPETTDAQHPRNRQPRTESKGNPGQNEVKASDRETAASAPQTSESSTPQRDEQLTILRETTARPSRRCGRQRRNARQWPSWRRHEPASAPPPQRSACTPGLEPTRQAPPRTAAGPRYECFPGAFKTINLPVSTPYPND